MIIKLNNSDNHKSIQKMRTKGDLKKPSVDISENSDFSFFLTGQANIREVCDELGIKEEELQPRDIESFKEPRLPQDMAKLRYDRYETKRREKLKLVKRALQEHETTKAQKLPALGSTTAQFRAQSVVDNGSRHNPNSADSKRINAKPLVVPTRAFEQVVKKEQEKIQKRFKVRKNKAEQFESEVKRIEEQIKRKAERELQRSQELGTKKDSFKQKLEELEKRRQNVKDLMRQRKVEEQERAVSLFRSRIKDIENTLEESRMVEKEKSKSAYESFIKKEKDKIEKYGSYLQKLKEEAEITKKRLEEYYSKMLRSEKLSNKRKLEVARTASATLERAREIYQKAEKEKQLRPDKVGKLLNKYQQMAKLAKTKAQAQEEKWRKKRTQYLEHLHKTEMARKLSQEREEERASEILNQREFKERHARESKMGFFEELRERFEAHRAKVHEAKRRASKMKETELLHREKLLEKQAIRNAQSEQVKLYQKQINAMRAEAALKMKIEEELAEDYTNPYIVAEMRATQKFDKKVKSSPKTNAENVANKTSGNFM